MQAAGDFDPVVVTHDYSFDGITFLSDDRVHRHLAERNIPHLRWNAMTAAPDDNLVRYMAPDIIFRQTPYEAGTPEPLRTSSLGFARLCYVPYNLYVADVPDSSVNYEFLLACWRIFAINASNKRYFARHSKVGDGRVVVTGLPKLDLIRETSLAGGTWPIASARSRLRILWAPHHSVDPQWLGFATFPQVHQDILAWARQDDGVEIVLRPHHLTFSTLVGTGIMTAAALDEFLAGWNALPNTAIDREPGCAATFGASDLLLTDGVSFLAEYVPTGKPLLFLDSGRHAGLTELGAAARAVAYAMPDIAAARQFVERFRADGLDPNAEARAALMAELMPFPGQAAHAIIEEIRAAIRPHQAVAA